MASWAAGHRLRNLLVPGAGALVLASSLAPWWVLRLADGGTLSEDGTGVDAVSAWDTAGWWPVGVAGAVAIAVVWTGWRLATGAVPGWLRWPLVLASLGPLALCVEQWRRIPPRPVALPPPSPPVAIELTVTAYIEPGDAFTDPGLDPARLYLDDSALSWQGPGWGLYAGIACLVLLTAALIVSGRGRPAPQAP